MGKGQHRPLLYYTFEWKQALGTRSLGLRVARQLHSLCVRVTVCLEGGGVNGGGQREQGGFDQATCTSRGRHAMPCRARPYQAFHQSALSPPTCPPSNGLVLSTCLSVNRPIRQNEEKKGADGKHVTAGFRGRLHKNAGQENVTVTSLPICVDTATLCHNLRTHRVTQSAQNNI